MEKVAATVNFPCKYANNGCQSTLLHTEKPDHEETCEFRWVKLGTVLEAHLMLHLSKVKF